VVAGVGVAGAAVAGGVALAKDGKEKAEDAAPQPEASDVEE
jgi:hypothetical protein